MLQNKNSLLFLFLIFFFLFSTFSFQWEKKLDQSLHQTSFRMPQRSQKLAQVTVQHLYKSASSSSTCLLCNIVSSSTSGKIMRRILRQIARNDKDLGDLSTLADPKVVEVLFSQRYEAAAWRRRRRRKQTLCLQTMLLYRWRQSQTAAFWVWMMGMGSQSTAQKYSRH